MMMIFIEIEVMNEGKEPFHDEMFLFILDSLKSDMFSYFEDVMTVMIEYFLECINS